MIKDNGNGTFSIVPTIKMDTVSVEMPRHQWEAVMKALDVALYHTENKPKPLSDEEMKELINNFPIIFSPQDLLTFGRAIEERHGIK